MSHVDENDNAAVIDAIGLDAFAKLKDLANAEIPARLAPFHASEDSGRLLPAIGFGSRAVIFVDKEGDLVTLAGVLAARCEQLRALVSMFACVSDGSDIHGNAVAACLEPSVELLFDLSEIVSNRLQRDRRLAERAQSSGEGSR